jgi:exosortase
VTTGDSSDRTRAEAPSGAGLGALALRWGWLLPLAAAFGPTLAWLWERWTRGVNDSEHGMFMPIVAAYLVREQLRSDPVAGERSSALGLGFVAAGLAMLALDSGIRSELLGAVGLVVVLPGLALLLLGPQRTLHIALPLLIAAMMLPIPTVFVSRLSLVLRRITAVAVEQIVPLVGPELAREGTLLYLPNTLVQVADACSGFQTLYASIATGLILTQLVRSRWRRVALLAACVPIALVTNWIRVSVLVLLAHHFGPQILDTGWHEATGLASFFLIALVALFAIAGREVLPDPNARPVDTPVSTRFAAPLTLLCCAGLVPVALNVYSVRQRDDCAHPQVLIAGTGIDDPELRSQRERAMQQQFDAFAFREGVVRGSPALAYSIIRTYDAKRVYHKPEYWLSDHSEAISSAVESIEAGGQRIPIHLVEFSSRRGEVRLAAYLLVYRGRPVADAIRAQIRAAPELMIRGARPMTLYYAATQTPPENAAQARQALSAWLAGAWTQYDAICIASAPG